METNNKPDIIKFLCGESDYKGVWFGERTDTGTPFWWRSILRDTIQERDAKISELENSIPKQGYYLAQHDLIHELKHKIAELEKDISERLDSMDRFDKAEKQWFDENQALKSELDKAVELLKSCKLDPQRNDSEELYQQIQDFLKDK